MPETQPLHLPDLYIEGFRGIDKLTIPHLGRVTLLAGKNGIGKSTVLDAVRVYAARGSHTVLYELLENKGEVFFNVADDERISTPNIEALFYDWDESLDSGAIIGSTEARSQMNIYSASHEDILQHTYGGQRPLPSEFWDADSIYAVKITFQNSTQIVPLGPTTRRRRLPLRQSNIPEIKCEFLGPDVLSDRGLARLWDSVALTDDENLAIDSLGLVYDSGVNAVAVVGDDTSGFSRNGRRMMVRLRSHRRPVPLRSLGDGAMRMFGVALALANSRDGFLLIDEAENGIHYTLQRDFWRMVLQTAQANNVQVLATTHSWDCVAGFAQAAVECEDAEGILYRLSRRYGDLRAVDYPENELTIAADHGIEVR